MTYPEIDPVAISIGPVLGYGPLNVHWYGIMYLLAFLTAWGLGVMRARRPGAPLQPSQIEDLIMYGAFGVILGGRCGYVLFYHFDKFLLDPFWLFRIWEGGMSFHGGFIGVIVAVFIYARKLNVDLLRLADFVAPLAPLGLCFGRLGNFIGQELWGRKTEGPWGMVFPNDPEQLTRHPSQLYQAALEGAALFAILFWFSQRPRPRGMTSGLFLMGYGCFRFLVEFVRQPDEHLKNELVFGWMSRGQLLSVPMVLAGAALMVWAWRQHDAGPDKNKI